MTHTPPRRCSCAVFCYAAAAVLASGAYAAERPELPPSWPDDVGATVTIPGSIASDRWQWPQFGGPTGTGAANEEAATPTEWSESRNVRWKLPLEGRGWSSPVVWDDAAYMTAATEDGSRMWGLCVDLTSGELRWRRELFENEAVSEIHEMNSYASPTPVTDGQRVWFSFGSYGTACVDASEGERLWERRDLKCEHYRGPGSSPVLVDGKLIVHMDGFDLQYVVALDALTGETVWKVDRDIDFGSADGDVYKAFATPLCIVDNDGKKQLISPASKAVLSYDPATGKELWRVRYGEFSATARVLWDGQTLYVNSGFGRAKLYAIDPSGSGDVTDTHIRWVCDQRVGSKASPALLGRRIFNVHDSGVATCIDADSGKVVWMERLDGMFSASVLAAGGHVYFFDHEGKTHVIRAADEYQELAVNELDDGCLASPAVVGDKLLVRTRSALYLIGQ